MAARFSKIIDDDEKTDWDKLDLKQNASMSFACSFCSVCGHNVLCPLSYESGCRFPRKAKVYLKADKELKNPLSTEQLTALLKK
jgi:hypothetical protein